MAKRPNKVTIVDVATEAGVSFGTVSRVLNQDAHVKSETRQRVLETIHRLGYVANHQARSLASGVSKVVGVLVPDLGTGYIGEIMRGIDVELGISGHDLVLYTTHRAAAKEANYVANLAQSMVDGLLIVLPRKPADYTGTLTERKFPFVLIDHQGTGEDCAAVGATNWQGAYSATEYLIKLGHQRIGFITGSLDLGAALDRLDGYKSALRTYHLAVDPQLIYEGTFNQPDGYTGAGCLLELEQPPTAIFASNDMMAMAAMDAARDRGYHVPQDISILGFDDIPQASLVRPALTTVRQPLEQMGRVATQMLLEIIGGARSKTSRIELPTELIQRNSTAAPKDRTG
ncbi:MAG: LacI family transcriptional regulator [Chloroflexi bacterium]|jgi:LacI family transcriptional regulator|nr:LacI family DNA-binding transcriptional regulator [Anaerolineaceae bacterium]NMB90835.1 LacI family transcriptional regulator [Chloroflexota bacterium]